MKNLNKNSIVTAVVVSLALGLAGPIVALAATAPNLGSAASFSVLGATSVTNTGVTTLSGDVGVSPGTSITNGGTLTVGGATHNNDATAIQAHSDVSTANGNMLGQAPTSNQGPALDGLTLVPGVYDIGAGRLNGGVLTLNGPGVYIFRASSDFVSSGSINFTNGARACDVYWDVQTLATINGTSFAGTIIAGTGVHFGNGVSLDGRALALGGDVTMIGDTISGPTCAAPPSAATLHVIKLVIGGTAVPSNFTVHVENASVDVAGSPAPGAAAPGTTYSLTAGTYTVSENANASYMQSFTGACNLSGAVTLSAGQDAICTIVNTAVAVPVVPPVVSGGASVNTGGGRIVPLIGITKIPTPLALPMGSGSVTYNYTVWNVGGQQALDDVTVTDDACSPVAYVSGDANGNGKLDPGEHWKYTCTTTLSTTTTNTAIATGYSDDGFHQASIATAVATVVVGAPITPPLINIVKVPSRLTPFPYGGGAVTYTYTVTNPGVVPMHNVVVTDNKCGPVTFVSGDANNNNLLDPGETWTYICETNVPVTTMDTAMAAGSANGFTAISYAFATVLVATPGLPNTGFPPRGNGIPWGIVTLVGVLVVASASLMVVLKKRKI